MKRSGMRLGELLLKSNLVTQEQLDKALARQKREKKPLGDLLVEMGILTEKDIVETLAMQLEIPYMSLEKGLMTPKTEQGLERLVPAEVARANLVLPLSREGNTLTLVLADPYDIVLIDNIKNLTKCKINPVIAIKADIRKAIDTFYGEEDLLKEAVDKSYDLAAGEGEKTEETAKLDEIMAKAETAPIKKLVDLILMEAIKSGASDIHIEPFERKMKLRYRIDGKLCEIPPPAEQMVHPLISRIKILSKLDIAEKRLPQDGSFTVKMHNKSIDFRVSTMPTITGEKVVIRILDKSSIMLTLEDMGFAKENLTRYRSAAVKPYGLIFITGPTGSGKSTTLYATLLEIAKPDKNIITIEDPVEYKLEGINQVQVKPQIGLTFASGLRTSLRQDPDIILVGEVRDLETAEICVRAALTGHLVLSTLHTNDAPSAVTRLVDFGIEPFLLGSSILMVVAQRLIRKLCAECKVEYQPSEEEVKNYNLKAKTIFKAKGCETCRQTGYKGRMGIYEILTINEKIRDLIYKGEPASSIKKVACEEGMESLFQSGIKKVEEGDTSLEEVLSAAYEG